MSNTISSIINTLSQNSLQYLFNGHHQDRDDDTLYHQYHFFNKDTLTLKTLLMTAPNNIFNSQNISRVHETQFKKVNDNLFLHQLKVHNTTITITINTTYNFINFVHS